MGDILLWFVAVLVLFLAGHWLTKKGTFTKTFRAVGFAQSVYMLAILALFPSLEPSIGFLVLVLSFLAHLGGAAAAHETRGWRTILLPVVTFIVLLAGYVIIGVLLAGIEFTVQGVLL